MHEEQKQQMQQNQTAVSMDRSIKITWVPGEQREFVLIIVIVAGNGINCFVFYFVQCEF